MGKLDFKNEQFLTLWQLESWGHFVIARSPKNILTPVINKFKNITRLTV